MKKTTKALAAISLMTVLTASFSACSDAIKYEKYANADAYTIGDASFLASQIKKVEIDWIGGSVEIAQSSDRVEVVEEESGADDDERMRYYLDGDVLRIKYCKSGLRGTIQEEQKNLRVNLPRSVALNLDSVSAVITVSTIELASLSIENVSGNLSAERISVQGKAEMETVSGTITVGDLITQGEVDFESVSGKITVGSVIGEKGLSVETTSGDFMATSVDVSFLEAETVSGNLSFGLGKPTSVEIESTSGDIFLNLLENYGATIYFETASGVFRCEREYGKVGSRYDVAPKGENTLSSEVNVDSFSGDLTVK